MNQHPFNPWSFLAGALFLLIAIGGAVVAADAVEPMTLLAASPIVLIALGIGGLALTFRRSA